MKATNTHYPLGPRRQDQPPSQACCKRCQAAGLPVPDHGSKMLHPWIGAEGQPASASPRCAQAMGSSDGGRCISLVRVLRLTFLLQLQREAPL